LFYLDILALEVRDFICEVSRGVHRTHHSVPFLQNAIVQADTEIILSKPRSLVDHSCTTLRCHIFVTVGGCGQWWVWSMFGVVNSGCGCVCIVVPFFTVGGCGLCWVLCVWCVPYFHTHTHTHTHTHFTHLTTRNAPLSGSLDLR